MSEAPERIWATVNGASKQIPSMEIILIGGWSEKDDKGTEFVRADLHDALEAENALLREVMTVQGGLLTEGTCGERAKVVGERIAAARIAALSHTEKGDA